MGQPPPRKRSSAGVSWGFTYNNPTHTAAELQAILCPLTNELVFQREKGEETGTEHYQGYARFIVRTRKPSLLAPGLPKIHWFACDVGFKRYCLKQDTRLDGPWSSGRASEQGRRTDLEACCAMIKEGKSNAEVADLYPCTYARYSPGLDRLRLTIKPTRKVELVVTLFYGDPGTGKTEMAYSLYPQLWRVPVGRDLWFSGYQGEPTVLIDDFSGNVGLDQLLQILDKYPVQLGTKGGHVWWCPERIIVTSNIHPAQWYDYTRRAKSWLAVMRRFKGVFKFAKDQEPIKMDSVETFFQIQQ